MRGKTRLGEGLCLSPLTHPCRLKLRDALSRRERAQRQAPQVHAQAANFMTQQD
jgi:hypothetical protein